MLLRSSAWAGERQEIIKLLLYLDNSSNIIDNDNDGSYNNNHNSTTNE